MSFRTQIAFKLGQRAFAFRQNVNPYLVHIENDSYWYWEAGFQDADVEYRSMLD